MTSMASEGNGAKALGYGTWAHLYDGMYEGAFGPLYETMTRQTVGLLEPGVRKVLDVGAGTGRLAIPLLLEGKRVTAIEPSPEMMARLASKAAHARVDGNLACIERRVEDIDRTAIACDHDAALCMFTSVHHLLDEQRLRACMQLIAHALRTGGSAIVGVHPPEVFESFGTGATHRATLPNVGRVSWTQRAFVDHRTSIVALDTIVTLPDGRTIEDRKLGKAWTATQVSEACIQAGLDPQGERGTVGTDRVLEFRKASPQASAVNGRDADDARPPQVPAPQGRPARAPANRPANRPG